MEVELSWIIAIKADICLALLVAEIENEEACLVRAAAIGERVRGVPANPAAITRARRGMDSAVVLSTRFCADVDAQECLYSELFTVVWQLTLADEPGIQAAVVFGRAVRADVINYVRRIGFIGTSDRIRRGCRLLCGSEMANLRDRALGTAIPPENNDILEEYDFSD